MHVPRVHAQSPQRHGTQFVGGVLRGILDDAVAGLDVVEQEVAVRMDDLIPSDLWCGERHWSVAGGDRFRIRSSLGGLGIRYKLIP
jgi:hypothetical protein